MNSKQDNNLMRELLVMLKEVEASMQPGDTLRNFQPHYEEIHVPNGIRIPNYDGEQIDFHLGLLLDKHYIDGQKYQIGIGFNHLTQAGHTFLNSQ